MEKGKIPKMKRTEETLKKIVGELLGLMGTSAKAEVSFDQENDAFVVDIDAGDETGLLIGKRGETLASLQVILGIILKQETDEWKRVIVNVGDYREKEEDYLRNLGLSAAERARETGEDQPLYNLKPGQRRIIHLALANEKGIETESVGQGEDRYLVVRAKK